MVARKRHHWPLGKKREGNAARYATRSQAVKQLQVTLGFFSVLVSLWFEIEDQKITWSTLHAMQQGLPDDVNFSFMLTFLEFYEPFPGFVGFRIHHSINVKYPPILDPQLEAITHFYGRVPGESLLFVVPAFGGVLLGTEEAAPYKEADKSITCQIVDRPTPGHKYLSREYVQPQWIYDCINARIVLQTEAYMEGS